MTRTEINNNFSRVIAIGYCAAQNLLRGQNRIGYNFGVNGWNYDVFAVDDVAICTGYRGMPGKRPAQGLVKEYEARARAVWEKCYLTYDQQREIVYNLLYDFVKSATEN